MVNRNGKGRITKRTFALAFVLMLLTASLIAFAEQGTVVTSGGRLNMRKDADERSRIVTKIKNGKTVEVLDHVDGWYHIRFDGQEGYVKEQFIRLLSEAVGKEIYSNGETLYVHESMDENSRIVGMINAQQSMTVETIDSEWACVSNGKTKGYVHTNEIDQLSEEPVSAVSKTWVEGILQSEITLYRDPDKKSEVLSTWPKGQGVSVSSYNKDWSIVQILEEDACGYARKTSINLSPMPTIQPDKQTVDESQYISASKAKAIAEKALKKYPGFNAKKLTCKQDTAFSTDGIRGPMFRFNYSNNQGQYVYAAYVHAYTGELLYTGDYSDFINQQDTSDLRTAPPKTTQDPQWWYDDDENVIWAEETPKPSEGTDIGQSSARSIADRYLSAKYAKFSQQEFSRVSCLHITDPTESGGFQVPYYQFDYFMIHGTGEDQREDLAYEIIINAYTKEIEYCSAASLGEGNG
ncbi:MAG: SH3 domain-containing protein [Anaerolineaceae bacterium]|nr:SH3 domain-containing protein [Anaerolineaceae bacterium]